jgi:cell wall-associated NlpC family hydrolase
MASMDYASNYLAQGSGRGIGALTGIYQNQRWAQNSTDLASANLQTAQTFGITPLTNGGRQQFAYQTSQLATAVGFDPTLSGSQAAGINNTMGSWNNYYKMRMYGIKTINNGHTMGLADQTAALTGLMTGGRKFTNMDQVSATFGSQSMTAYNLQNMGYDQNTINYMLTQGRANAIGAMNGKTSTQMSDLMAQYQKGGTAASKSAGATLSKMGFTDTMLQSMKNVTASQTNRNADLLPGFSSGVQDATTALVAFKNALTNIINPASGALGFGAGAGGIAGSALNGMGGIAGIYGAGKLATKVGAGLLSKLGTAGRAVPKVAAPWTGPDALAPASIDTAAIAGDAGAIGMGVLGTASLALAPIAIAATMSNSTEKALGQVNIGKSKGHGSPGWWRAQGYSQDSSGHWSKASAGIGGGAGSGSPTGGPGASAAATGTQGAGKTGAAVVAVARRQLGVPYKWGGSSPSEGFDCSGLTQYCFAQIGVSIPRVAADQQKAGQAIPANAVQAGDLVFFGQPAHHVALVTGSSSIIEAPHTGTEVRARSFSTGEITNARRILGSVGGMNSIGSGTGSSRLLSGGNTALIGSNGSISEAAAIAGATMGSNFSLPSTGSSVGSVTGATIGSSASSMSNGSLMATLAGAGFSGAGLAMAYKISMAESGGNAGKHNGNAGTGDNSYGLFQINMLGAMGPSRLKQYGLSSNNDLLNAATNARVAYQMSGGGTDWNAWSTYKSGAYKQYGSGAYSVGQDQLANVHEGEMILTRHDANTVRQALLANNGMSSKSSGGGGVALHFATGSIQVSVQGAMTTSAASDAASKIVTLIAHDQRIANIRAGNLNG